MKLRGEKKAVSPVVATVTLISIVVVLGIIIFMAALFFLGEKTMKDGEPISNSCENVRLTASIDVDGNLRVQNIGNVPMVGIRVMIEENGNIDPIDETILITSGQTQTVGTGTYIPGEIDSIIPILLGETDEGTDEYICEDNEFTLN